MMTSFTRSPLFIPTMIGLALAITMLVPSEVSAEVKCSSMQGRVECLVGRLINGTVEMRDRDGVFDIESLDVLNPDDLMDRAHVTPDGLVTLSGCADDIDWLWLANWPEPYLWAELLCDVQFEGLGGVMTTRRHKTDVMHVYSPYMLSGFTLRV